MRCLLAGDVVEQEDDFYEAYGDLRRGVDRLAAAGIPVLAVSGNHDVQVLPRPRRCGARLSSARAGWRLGGRGRRGSRRAARAGARLVLSRAKGPDEPVRRP